jgi:hypothetical protein
MFENPLPPGEVAAKPTERALAKESRKSGYAPSRIFALGPPPPLRGSPPPLGRILAAALLLAALPLPAFAQEHDHSQMDHAQHNEDNDCQVTDECEPPQGLVSAKHLTAQGSGTARLPGYESGHYGHDMTPDSDWTLMLHGYAWGVHTNQYGPRGDSKTYVQSMAMLTAEKETSFGRIQLKSMLSAEPLMKNSGYPNLFATGETNNGNPLVDRQHPHDLFMELAARIDINVADNTRLFLYGGPVGEPALGPSAFMHRGSAKLNPEAPITHHWFDSTHITYGVATAGVATDTLQLEGSIFTGREPDEKRWNIEKPRFDSWSVRATWNPSPQWALQASHGRLKNPEFLIHPGENERRTTASVHYASGRNLSAMIAFSAKNRDPGRTLTAFLAEANWDIDDHHTVFGRIENVKNDELFPDDLNPLHEVPFRVSKFQAGYAYRLPVGDKLNLALGGSVSTFATPAALNAAYGKHPVGATVFAKLSLGH